MNPKATICTLFVAATALFATASANAVSVRGDPSCGNWTEERPKKSISSLANEFWLLGFLSALAMETNRDFIKGTDNASLFQWMDSYCKENPLSYLSDGGYKLLGELRKRKGV